MRVGEGDGRRDLGVARPAETTVDPACDVRSATNEEDDCDAGAECGARDASICRATAVREGASRAPPEEKRCRGSGG